MWVKKFFFLFTVLLIWMLLPAKSFGFNSASPPPNVKPKKVHSSIFRGPTKGEADILLIQSNLPWGSNADTKVLDSLGYSYDIADMSEIPNIDLASYQVILIVNDQTQSFYDFYKENYNLFEQYVKNGGTLVFFACDHGWARGDLTAPLPGGVLTENQYELNNYIEDKSHPIVTGELTDNQPISNEELKSNYCSHGYFSNIEELVNNGTITNLKVIFKGSDSNMPTFIEYQLGKGHVIASMNTWEFSYDRHDQSNIGDWAYKALDDVFKYAFTLAGSYTKSNISISNVYIDNNWEVNGRPVVFKNPGDLVNVVAVISNKMEKSANVTLEVELPEDIFDTSFLRVLKRSSAQEIINKKPEEIDKTKIQQKTEDGKWIISVTNLNITPDVSGKWHDFVFKLRIKKDKPLHIRRINPIVRLINYDNNEVLDSKKLTDFGNPGLFSTWPNLIITNNELMYKFYGISQYEAVNRLWNKLYKLAAEHKAVIYYVDDYDKFVFDPNDNPTVTWLTDRKNLPYDSDTSTGREETRINKVAILIKQIIKSFIDNSGGIGQGRYVVIVGPDDVIPMYRLFVENENVRKKALIGDRKRPIWERYYNSSSIIKAAARNGYILTDNFYRDYDGKGWKEGGVEDIYVGRIIGKNPDDMIAFITSSNKITSSTKNVVKLENAKRDGELSRFEEASKIRGYSIIKEVNGVTLDYPLIHCEFIDRLLNKCKKYKDDPATWDNALKPLFTGTTNIQFDIFRAMTHGSIHGIYSSEPYYHPYITDDFLNNFHSSIRQNFSKFYPFFIFDVCLVGLTDGQNKKSFMYSLVSQNIRGVLASTAITYSSFLTTYDISGFNDSVCFDADGLLNKKPIGKALTEAIRNFVDTRNYYTEFSAMEMNYYGLPWATITPPNASGGRGKSLQKLSFRIVQATRGEGLKYVEDIDASDYQIESSEMYDIVTIKGFDLLQVSEKVPVIPVLRKTISLPKGSKVNNVNVSFSESQNLGKLYIPGFVPCPDTEEESSFLVPLSGDIGIFPTKQYEYRVVEHSDRTDVIVTLYPVVFDSKTHNTTLFKKGRIEINYLPASSGVVSSFSIDKQICSPGEVIKVYSKIKNISASTDTYDIKVSITDPITEEEVSVATNTVTIDSGNSNLVETEVQCPDVPKTYGYVLNLLIKDGDGNIVFSDSRDIQVKAVKIVSFSVPESVKPGEYANFSVQFTNTGKETIDKVLVTFYVYDGGNLVAKLPELVESNVQPGETRTVKTQWFPPSDLVGKSYSVKAVIAFNNHTLSTDSAPLRIGNLPPKIVALTTDNTSGTAPLTVTFTCSAKDVDGNVISYEWDLDGDGKVDKVTTENTVTYTFDSAGIYDVSVRAIDNENAISLPYYVTINVVQKVEAPSVSDRQSIQTASGIITLEVENADIQFFSSATETPIKGYVVLYKALSFRITLPQGEKETRVSITFPSIPEGSRFFKCLKGKCTDITDKVSVSGTTVTYTVTDGGIFDADGREDGVIVDPIELAQPEIGKATSSNEHIGCSISPASSASVGMLNLLIMLSGLGALRIRNKTR